MGKLTKRDLVLRISDELGMPQNKVSSVVEKAFAHIANYLADGGEVEVRTFGVFQVRLAQKRVGRNPKKPGSRYEIPERAQVKFKMGKALGQKVSRLTTALRHGKRG